MLLKNETSTGPAGATVDLEIEAISRDRLSTPQEARSLLRHVYDTVGVALLFTLAAVCCVVYACFVPSPAAASSLPGKDATPSEIVRLILTDALPEIAEMRDGPLVKLVVASTLRANWARASAAASKLNEPFIDMNWITTGQDFELSAYRLVAPSSSEVVAYLKGKAGETRIVTYLFAKEAGVWKLSDVAYGGGSNPEHLTRILQRELDAPTPLVTVPRGFGPSAPFALGGPAADTVKTFLAETTVHCEFAREGRCALGQLATQVDLRYVDTKDGKSAVALAFITRSVDRSGMDVQMLAVWTRSSDGRYQEQAHDDIEALTNPHVVGMRGDAVVVSGETLGPRDSYCCPTDPTVFKVTFSGGTLDIDVARRDPRVDDASRYVPRLPFTPLKTNAAESDVSPHSLDSERAATGAARSVASGRPATQTLAPSKDRTGHVALDLRHYTYQGEPGELKDHNGSDVLVFEKAGLIVYAKPKASLAGAVKSGDVLFRGRIAASGIEGQAYAFKNGCPPIGYRVRGQRYKPDGNSDFSIELHGKAPVRTGGCEASRFSSDVPNATLRFGFAAPD